LKEYGRFIQIFGGSLILFFSARVTGLDRWIGRFLNEKFRGGVFFQKINPLRLLRRVSQKAMASRPKDKSTGGLKAFDSFLVGVGLSSSCLTCMGGAVLYPLLVYAGISNWYSGLITLSVYSLCIAVPMAMIALGFFNVRMALGRRLGFNRVLRVTSGVLLAVIGTLVMTGSDRILTDITFKFLGQVSRWVN
jgi:cytochrome c biogenesis protein CcdA